MIGNRVSKSRWEGDAANEVVPPGMNRYAPGIILRDRIVIGCQEG